MNKVLPYLAGFAQLILFYVVFLAGTLLNPFPLRWFVTHPTPDEARFFNPDGLILMSGMYILILLAEAAFRRFPRQALPTTIAFALAVLFGFISKIGFATHEMY
jgi:hypothetical protein